CDAPFAVVLGRAQRAGEPAQRLFGLLQTPDLVERDGGTKGHLDPPGEIAILLTELGEDILQPALERPLEIVVQGGHRLRSRAGAIPVPVPARAPSRTRDLRRAPALRRAGRARWRRTAARRASRHPRWTAGAGPRSRCRRGSR